MLTRIENGEVFLRFMRTYRKHNSECPWYTSSRTCKKTGRITEFKRQRGVIPESVKTTFHMILSEYVKSYVNVAATMPAGMYNDADPPSLLTNSVKLGFLCDCSDRTIRSHVAILSDLGIVRKKFHGDKHNYELWISPEFLYGGEGPDNFKKRQIRPETALNSTNTKIFPHSNTHREVLEIKKREVDMFVEHGEGENGEKGRTDSDSPAPEERAMQTEKYQTGGGRPRAEKAGIVAENERKRLEKASQVLKGKLLKGPRGLETKFLNVLLDFWFYAWKSVYPYQEFTKEQQERALVAIMDGVYNNFSDELTDKEWVDFQVLQLTKLDKAHKYYDHHPEQYAPAPYTISIPGRGYFDRANQKGFAAIDGWIREEKEQKIRNKEARDEKKIQRELKCKELLRKARVDMERCHAGLELRKETKFMDISRIYFHYHNILRGMGKKYADRLDEQFIQQKRTDFAPPKYDKAKRMRRMAHKLSNDPAPATIVYTESWMEGDGEGYYVSG